MHFHRRFSNPDVGSDLLVQAAGRSLDHDLTLTGAERLVALPERGQGLFVVPTSTIASKTRFDRVNEILIAEWLGEEFNGTFLHRLHGHGNVPVRGYEYDWQVSPRSRKLALQIEPAGPRHSDVDQQASWPRRAWRSVQEFRHGCILLAVQTYGAQKASNRVTKLGVVVDNQDTGAHGRHTGTPKFTTKGFAPATAFILLTIGWLEQLKTGGQALSGLIHRLAAGALRSGIPKRRLLAGI